MCADEAIQPNPAMLRKGNSQNEMQERATFSQWWPCFWWVTLPASPLTSSLPGACEGHVKSKTATAQAGGCLHLFVSQPGRFGLQSLSVKAAVDALCKNFSCQIDLCAILRDEQNRTTGAHVAGSLQYWLLEKHGWKKKLWWSWCSLVSTWHGFYSPHNGWSWSVCSVSHHSLQTCIQCIVLNAPQKI